MKKHICASLIGLLVAGASQGVAAEGASLPGFNSDEYQEHAALAGSAPGVGAMGEETASHEDMLLGGPAIASVQYRRGAFFVGGEAGYQASTEERFGAGGWDTDNVRVLLEVGVNL